MKIVLTIVVGGALLATGIGGALGVFGGVAQGAGLSAGLATGIGFGGLTYGTVALLGAGLLLGGLSMALTPTPKTTANDERKQDSFVFDGPANASEEGTAIPLAYGLLVVGGVTIASDISNGVPSSGTGVVLNPDGTYYGGGGGGYDGGGATYDGGRGTFSKMFGYD